MTNARPGEKLKLALAAVDEGILQLTDYASPAPSAYYFGKRRLGVDIRDDYGRLIKSAEGAVGPIREGGDSLGGRSLAVVPTRTVALFSGLVDVDDRGRAKVKLDIPDFVGELRLMAVAFGASRIGEASKPLTVRDAVVGELTLPRFLAPGDKASGTLLVDNVEGNFGTYRTTVSVSGSLVQDKPQVFEASIDRGERKTFRVPLTAGKAGIGTAHLTLEGPNSLHIDRTWPIEIRPPMLPVFDEKVASLAPGAEARVDASFLQGYTPESASLTLAVAATRGFDVPALLKWLDRYPYGCLEQTTSRAMPLLYVSALAKAAGIASDKGIQARVQEAIERVVDMQHYSGGFGMWGAMSEPADPWLAVFAVDFLVEARGQGYVVPQASLNRAFDWLRGFAAQDSQPAAARAYALYVLARTGTAKAGDVRYFYDTESSKFSDVIVPALSAAALAQVGDRARARAGFKRAEEIARDSSPENYNAQPYGSFLRDMAGLHGACGVIGRSGDGACAHDAHGRDRAAHRLYDDAGEGVARARRRRAQSRAKSGERRRHGRQDERRARHGLGRAHARRARCGADAQEYGPGAPLVERHGERRARDAAARRSQGHHHREALFHPRRRGRRSRQRSAKRALCRLDQGRDGRRNLPHHGGARSPARGLRDRGRGAEYAERRGGLSVARPGHAGLRRRSARRPLSSRPSISATATWIRRESARPSTRPSMSPISCAR